MTVYDLEQLLHGLPGKMPLWIYDAEGEHEPFVKLSKVVPGEMFLTEGSGVWELANSYSLKYLRKADEPLVPCLVFYT